MGIVRTVKYVSSNIWRYPILSSRLPAFAKAVDLELDRGPYYEKINDSIPTLIECAMRLADSDARSDDDKQLKEWGVHVRDSLKSLKKHVLLAACADILHFYYKVTVAAQENSLRSAELAETIQTCREQLHQYYKRDDRCSTLFQAMSELGKPPAVTSNRDGNFDLPRAPQD